MSKRLLVATPGRVTGVLTVCAVIALAALPSPAQSKASISDAGDVIRFDGVIDPASATEFVSLLNERIKSVEIYSGGGESLSAIRMGREIRARRLTVIVDKACLSACAHFIFLPATKRVVRPNSLVVFHNTSSSINKLIGSGAPATTRSYFEPRAKAESEFFSASGIPAELLFRPQLEVVTECYFYQQQGNSGFEDVKFAAHYAGWIPTAEFLQSNGIAMDGFWPTSPETFSAAWRNVFQGPRKPALRLGAPPMTAGQIDEGFRRIKECAPGAVGR